MQFAIGVALMLVAAGLACLLHGLVPGCCTRTASRTVNDLARLFQDRHALNDVMEQSSGALTLAGLALLTLPAWMLFLLAPGHPMTALTSALPFAIPATYLWTNPQLEPV
jgi:uncharacterized protein YjeT (DUF2065 family)